MRRLSGLLLVALALLLVACGGGAGGDGRGAPTSEEVDTDALNAAILEFGQELLDDFGSTSPPVYSGGDVSILYGFPPEGEDPVSFCERMAGFFGEVEGPTGGVTIHIVRTLEVDDTADPLATGQAGGDCSEG